MNTPFFPVADEAKIQAYTISAFELIKRQWNIGQSFETFFSSYADLSSHDMLVYHAFLSVVQTLFKPYMENTHSMVVKIFNVTLDEAERSVTEHVQRCSHMYGYKPVFAVILEELTRFKPRVGSTKKKLVFPRFPRNINEYVTKRNQEKSIIKSLPRKANRHHRSYEDKRAEQIEFCTRQDVLFQHMYTKTGVLKEAIISKYNKNFEYQRIAFLVTLHALYPLASFNRLAGTLSRDHKQARRYVEIYRLYRTSVEPVAKMCRELVEYLCRKMSVEESKCIA